MSPENALVAVCKGVADAAVAVSELRGQGIEPDRISVVTAEHSLSTPTAYYFEGGHARTTAPRRGHGPYLDDLPGSAVLVIPGERAVFLAGAFAASVVRVLDHEELFGGLGPIASGLYNLGLPSDAAREYELSALQGRILVIVHGPAGEVARARQILAGCF